jgi:hypothetical protein
VITIRQIQSAVSAATGVSLDEMRGRKRTAPIVLARHTAMWLARKLTQSSYPEIAATFGGVDHSTVMHACKQVRERLIDPSFSARVSKIQAALMPRLVGPDVPVGLSREIMAEIQAARDEAPKCPPYKSKIAWAA